jgi:hypothetical protein
VLGGMYLDGKYALRKDIQELRKRNMVIKLYMKAGKFSRPHRKLII